MFENAGAIVVCPTGLAWGSPSLAGRSLLFRRVPCHDPTETVSGPRAPAAGLRRMGLLGIHSCSFNLPERARLDQKPPIDGQVVIGHARDIESIEEGLTARASIQNRRCGPPGRRWDVITTKPVTPSIMTSGGAARKPLLVSHRPWLRS